MQCHCPQCEAEGYNYNGRYFKAPDANDIRILNAAETEWTMRSEQDLHDYWPREICWDAYMMRANGGVNDGWGYTNWWKMFNSRQLLTHAQILRKISLSDALHSFDVCEQTLGAFQQLLRYCCMFSFYQQQYDKTIPSLSNDNFHPKLLTSEINAFAALGAGRMQSCSNLVIDGLSWLKNSYELFVFSSGDSAKLLTDEKVVNAMPFCGSSTDISMIPDTDYDLVITDPPFGNNLFYADLADFFYVWLRIPMLKWYDGQPEAEYFKPKRTPHSTEAIDNSVEHPDDREEYEKAVYIDKPNLESIRTNTGDHDLQIGDANPLYRPEPSGEFYSRTLAACWAEAGRHLKPGGIMAFTFHHNDDNAWIDVLKALFEAGYYLIATYPIRSDETKGDNAAFGSKKIEYDVIHVCRKRLTEPEQVSYARMRKFVREEATRLKSLLETVHGKELPEADLRVILRGKSLEFYSQHYGVVQTGTGEMLGVRDALLGINQMLDDILEDAATAGGLRPPESADPVSRLYLRIFKNVQTMSRDTLHKTLQGSGVSQNDLESHGWIHVTGREVTVTPVAERYAALTKRGLNRKYIKSDLDQVFFLMGTVQAGKNLLHELESGNLKLKLSVRDILNWYAQTSDDAAKRQTAIAVLTLMAQFEQKQKAKAQPEQQMLFDFFDEEEQK